MRPQVKILIRLGSGLRTPGNKPQAAQLTDMDTLLASILTIREQFDCACLYLLASRLTFSQGLSICSQYSQTVSQRSCRPQRCDCTIKQKLVLSTCDFCTSLFTWITLFLTVFEWFEWVFSTHCLLIYDLSELMCYTSCMNVSLSQVMLHPWVTSSDRLGRHCSMWFYWLDKIIDLVNLRQP